MSKIIKRFKRNGKIIIKEVEVGDPNNESVIQPIGRDALIDGIKHRKCDTCLEYKVKSKNFRKYPQKNRGSIQWNYKWICKDCELAME